MSFPAPDGPADKYIAGRGCDAGAGSSADCGAERCAIVRVIHVEKFSDVYAKRFTRHNPTTGTKIPMVLKGKKTKKPAKSRQNSSYISGNH